MAMFIVVNAMASHPVHSSPETTDMGFVQSVVGRYIPIAATYPKSYTPVDNLFLWCNL